MTDFTIKQKKFIEYYLLSMNGVEAARKAGYQGSYSTLGVVAHENLKKPKIKKEIESRLSELTMSADEVLYRLQRQAKGSLSEFLEIDDTGELQINLNKADEADALDLAKEVSQDKKIFTYDDGTVETTYKTTVKIHDSQSALDKLMRYYGLYKDKVDVTSGGEKIQPITYITENRGNDNSDS